MRVLVSASRLPAAVQHRVPTMATSSARSIRGSAFPASFPPSACSLAAVGQPTRALAANASTGRTQQKGAKQGTKGTKGTKGTSQPPKKASPVQGKRRAAAKSKTVLSQQAYESEVAPLEPKKTAAEVKKDRIKTHEEGLKAACEEFDAAGAQAHLDALRTLRAATAEHFNVLLLLHSRVRDTDQFDNVLKAMAEEGIAPDDNTLRQQLAAAMMNGESHKARKLLDQIPSENRTGLDYCAVLEAIAADGHSTRDVEAQEVLDEMQAGGHEMDVMGYTAMIKLFANDGDIAQSTVWLQKLRDSGAKPIQDTYIAILLSYAMAAQNAVQDIEGVSKPSTEDARRYLDEAIAENLDSEATFNVMCDIHSTLGDTVTARAIVEEMEERGHAKNSDTFTALLFGYVMASDIKGALGVLKEQKGLGINPEREDFALVVQGALGIGEETLIEQTLEMAEECGVVLNDSDFQTIDWESDGEDQARQLVAGESEVGGENERGDGSDVDGEGSDESEEYTTTSDSDSDADNQSNSGSDAESYSGSDSDSDSDEYIDAEVKK